MIRVRHRLRSSLRHWPRPFALCAIACGFLFIGPITKILAASPANASGALRVYFIDVEGGWATLFVTPSRQSLLIDTGWPDNDGRDANRIFAAAKKARHSVTPEFIANLEGQNTANYLELTAWPDGSFGIFNSRTQKTEHCAAR